MKKVALVFIFAVFLPSLVLACLAIRSLRDQQFILERQQSLLYQGVADSLAREARDLLTAKQQFFANEIETLLRTQSPNQLARNFDQQIRSRWPLAEIGFAVNLGGELLSPAPTSSPAAQLFCAQNSKFLANKELAEVYNWNPKLQQEQTLEPAPFEESSSLNRYASKAPSVREEAQSKTAQYKNAQRVVVPQKQQQGLQAPQPTKDKMEEASVSNVSKVAPSEAEFRQLIGDENEGVIARFLDDKLRVLIWYRPPRDRRLVFGAQLLLATLAPDLKTLTENLEPALREEICVAVLDDKARPVMTSHSDFKTNWKHPFVATEIGEALPHWEVAVYLLNPAQSSQSARNLRLILGGLIALLVIAIALGGVQIFADLKRQEVLTRQKTDFVSNVSHELKTPLTSIRMFSELLAEGRVEDFAKQKTYLNIITAEAARLTRLINNVLDFSRIDRGEKKYHFEKCDLGTLTRETIETYRPHLEANGFHLDFIMAAAPMFVSGDRDALAQVIVNLLSNAEKYSGGAKTISVDAATDANFAMVKVLDRGPGVPRGCEEKIFEQFYRAHDSLSSGIQGSGLGLTLARQIARAHGGDVVYESRPDGGSCFTLKIPMLKIS